MSCSVLIVGFGSIGQRHATILSNMNAVAKVTVLSSQKIDRYDVINSIEEVERLDPDYIVIASETSSHYRYLSFLDKAVRNKKILVEKPLFDTKKDFWPSNNAVWVAYVLRFHPILQQIKELVSKSRLWNVNVFCGSFLPDWRPGRDYRKTSSAKKSSGGGVLLDLSHEFDYIQWIIGKIKLDYVYTNKVSSLEIETDDLAIINAHNSQGTQVQIHLNYFTKKPKRDILIDGEGLSIQADLVSNTMVVAAEGNEEIYNWDNFNSDELYKKEHKALLTGELTSMCSYDEGQKVMDLITQIENRGRY